MSRSNFIFRLMTMLSATFVVVGCMKPQKQDASQLGDQEATFRVVTGGAVGLNGPVLNNDPWAKPFSVTFRFTARVNNRDRDEKIKEQKFQIYDPVSKAKIEEVSSTNDGEIVWTEAVPFNYFAARSNWVTVEREIVASGIYAGKRRVSFAINPWLVAGRKEISPSQSGYYLADEPIELKNPSSRLQKIYDFLVDSLKSAGGVHVLSSDEKISLAIWKKNLEDGFSKGTSILSLPAEASSFLNGQKEGNASLWISSIDFQNVKIRNIMVDADKPNSETGYIVNQTLEMKPRLAIVKANGVVDYEDLTDGDFDVYVQVVATDTGFNQNKRLILTESLEAVNAADPENPNSPKGTGHITDGKLTALVSFKATREVAEGNLQYVVRLVPRRIANRAPKDFEGIFNVAGKVNTWVGNPTHAILDSTCDPKFGSTLGCSYDGYLRKTDKFEDMLKSGEAQKAEPYRFTMVKGRFVQVDMGHIYDNDGKLMVTPGETATHRRILYSASVCVTDQSGNRVVHQQFKIRYLKESEATGNYNTISKTTNDDGCLLWTNTVEHGYYKPEQFFRQVIAIDGPGGARRVKTLYINPWDDKFTFSFDELELGKEYFEEIAKRPKIPSRFYMGDYSYHTVRFMYQIDQYMDLEVKKTVLMDLAPQVLRYSGLISGRKVTEYLRDGIYMMKVAIQKSYLDPADRLQRLCTAERERAVYDKDGNLVRRVEHVTIDGAANPDSDQDICALSEDQRRISLEDQQAKNAKAAQAVSGSPAPGIDKFGDSVKGKEFITTKTTLVRVTDGYIVYPVELSMRDLRLMRIRSNFLIELVPVDERKVFANSELSQTYRNYVAEDLKLRREKEEEFRKDSLGQDSEETIEKDRKQFNEMLLLSATQRRNEIRSFYENEINRLDVVGNIVSDFNRSDESLAKLLKRFEDVTNPNIDFKNLDPEKQAAYTKMYEKYQFYKKMARNDFTTFSLPDCDREKSGCLDLVDHDSGLEPRTFVGPVIFLSNTYKDAMRATDNLDEARCHEEIEGVDYFSDQIDPVERELREMEVGLFAKSSASLEGQHSNNAYRYSKYFNSLRQFCTRKVPDPSHSNGVRTEFYAKQVDDLIREEAMIKQDYAEKMKALATPYNFASLYNLKFVSFGGEKLTKIDQGRLNKKCADKGIENCMVQTTENSVTVPELVSLANRDLSERATYMRLNGIKDFGQPTAGVFSAQDLQNAIFSKNNEGTSQAALCGVLTNMVVETHRRLAPNADKENQALFANRLFRECYSAGKGGFVRDRRLRVYNTGDYLFMGGVQLNFNVGSSFGVSRSNGVSAGIDMIDIASQAVAPLAGGVSAVLGTALGGPVVGAVVGGVAYGMLKPVDLKRSKGLSSSKGTSVAEGTYLVGQVAKFSIPLKEWEQCAVIRLRPELAQMMTRALKPDLSYQPEFPGTWIVRGFWGESEPDEQTRMLYAKANELFGRGIFACDGVRRTQSTNAKGQLVDGRDVEEQYYYFTQHFTEGDMLDQADLYNHPWLLSLRGKRDFTAFVNAMQAEDVVDIRSYVDGLTGTKPKSERSGWALEQLANTYKSVLPSFPGLYTVLDEDERDSYFQLRSKDYSNIDFDINREVNRGTVESFYAPSPMQRGSATRPAPMTGLPDDGG